MMVIGIDADGVLNDMAGFNFKYGTEFFGHKPVDPTGYKTRDIFGESKTREFLFGLFSMRQSTAKKPYAVHKKSTVILLKIRWTCECKDLF